MMRADKTVFKSSRYIQENGDILSIVPGELPESPVH